MKEFSIWSEGYADNGGREKACFHGKVIAENFIEACEKIPAIDKNPNGTLRLNNGTPAIWGCRCFDNESDARKSFG